MSRFIPSQKCYTPEGSAETNFNILIKQYDRYIGKLMADNNVLRLITFISIFSFIFALGFLVYAINLPETKLLVVEVSEFGEPKYVGKVDNLKYTNVVPKEYMIKNHIERFIINTREVMLDQEVMYRNINNASFWVSRQMKEKVKSEIIEADLFNKSGNEKRLIEFESVIKITNNTFQVDFYEITSSIYGIILSKKKYRGLFTIAIQEPNTDREKQMNPLGIYIVDYNYSFIKEEAK